jgi:AraC-like DNA-binding protein
VEEAKRLLSHPSDPKVTVLEVMYQAGFNSKSSFNTAFRKIEQTTPGAYKKAHAL